MALLNYTTTVDAIKTAGEIEVILIKMAAAKLYKKKLIMVKLSASNLLLIHQSVLFLLSYLYKLQL